MWWRSARDLRAEQAAGHREDEQEDADPAAGDLHRPARQRAADPPGSGRQCSRSSFGFGHSAASRTKETIRTRAAAQKKSQSGIGMSERAATPWAYAGAGAVEARTAPTATAFAARLTD
jgi:hypothetical protein